MGLKNESSARILRKINLEVRGHALQGLCLAGDQTTVGVLRGGLSGYKVDAVQSQTEFQFGRRRRFHLRGWRRRIHCEAAAGGRSQTVRVGDRAGNSDRSRREAGGVDYEVRAGCGLAFITAADGDRNVLRAGRAAMDRNLTTSQQA